MRAVVQKARSLRNTITIRNMRAKVVRQYWGFTAVTYGTLSAEKWTIFEKDGKVARTSANAGAVFFLAPPWPASGTMPFLVSKFPLLGGGEIHTLF